MVDSADDEKFYSGQVALKDLSPDDYEIIDVNRDPTPQEIKACSPHLEELLADEKPNGIILLGNIAAKACPITKLPKLKLLHPAYIGRLEYKLITVKKEARKLEHFVEKL